MTSRLTNTLVRIYRALLILYPESTRALVGKEMVTCFRDLCTEAELESGWRGILWVALRTFVEMPRSAVASRRTRKGKSGRVRGGSGGVIRQDLTYAARGLARSPGFTAVAVLSLAVGIGANTAVISLANGVLWRELPVKEPERLVTVFPSPMGRGRISWLNFRDIRDQADVFNGAFLHLMRSFGMSTGEVTQVVHGELVTVDYFQVLGIRPLHGRFFDPQVEGRPNSPLPLVLSHHLWASTFGSDPGVVGRTLRLNGHTATIVGVAPESFLGTKFALAMDLWAPIRTVTAQYEWYWFETSRTASQCLMIARLAPGVGIDEANAALETIGRRISDDLPPGTQPLSFQALPERAGSVARSAPILLDLIGILILGASGLVLLVACANVASLLLARGAVRREEMGARIALGASRARLVRMLLSESALLVAAGGALGVALAYWIAPALLLERYRPSLPYRFAVDATPDHSVFLFVVAAAMLATFASGLIPALKASNPTTASVMKREEHGPLRAVNRLMNGVVVGMVSLSFVALFSAWLFTTSLGRARTIDLGFETEHRLLAAVDLTLAGYEPEAASPFFTQLLERIRSIPGVVDATVSSYVPLADRTTYAGVFAEDRAYQPDDTGVEAWYSAVMPGYFQVSGTPLLAGRGFQQSDVPGQPGVVIVNETLAEQLWPGEEPLGKHLRIPSQGAPGLEVVGVARTGVYRSVGEAPYPAIFRPLPQAPARSVFLLVRGGADPTSLLTPVREVLSESDPALALFDVKTVEAHFESTLWPFRTGAEVGMALGVLALTLAACGLYGVVAFRVGHRRKEMGIRIALGAGEASVLTLVLRGVSRLVASGVAIGVVGALLAAGFLDSILVGVTPYSPLHLGIAALVLIAVAAAATLKPALAATRADPLQVIRSE